MKHSEALVLLAKLSAGWPAQRLPDTSIEVYATQLAQLEDPSVLDEAVESLLRTQKWFPTIGEVWAKYFEVADTRKPKELPPVDFGPELTPSQLDENKRRLVAMMTSLEASIEGVAS